MSGPLVVRDAPRSRTPRSYTAPACMLAALPQQAVPLQMQPDITERLRKGLPLRNSGWMLPSSTAKLMLCLRDCR